MVFIAWIQLGGNDSSCSLCSRRVEWRLLINLLKWIPTGTRCPPLISTEEILHGGVFITDTGSEDCFHLFTSERGPLSSSLACINALQEHDKKAGAAFSGLRANEGLPGARKTIWLNAFLSSCHFLSLTGSIALRLVCGGHCKWLDVVCNVQKTF